MNIQLPGKAATFQANQRERAEKQRAQLGVEARSWYRITNAADSDEAEVMLYDEIGGWFGATADEFIADLKGITAQSMRVRVNSLVGRCSRASPSPTRSGATRRTSRCRSTGSPPASPA